MDNLYRDFILEHYRQPHNKGVLQPHDLHFADSNPTCGDEMSMTLRLDEAKKAIADVAFDGRGCAISQASASILTDELRGQTLDEVRAIDPKHALEVIRRNRLPVDRTVEVGVRIHQPAGFTDEARVLFRPDVGRAAKHHVLEEVCESCAPFAFILGPDAIPHLHVDDRPRRVRREHDLQAVLERM